MDYKMMMVMLAILWLTGCTHIGPQTLPRDRFDYNTAIADSWKEQTEGKHAHEGLAFTTWLGLSQAAKQTNAVAAALARKRPQQADFFKTNVQALEKDLLELDSRIRSIVSSNNDLSILFSHPVYQYFQHAYPLRHAIGLSS